MHSRHTSALMHQAAHRPEHCLSAATEYLMMAKYATMVTKTILMAAMPFARHSTACLPLGHSLAYHRRIVRG
jgi:hypothetical protein